MKFRFGFISNSSSTTFVCPACNYSFSGWDWDDDPVCLHCGCHIYSPDITFSDYLIKKYSLNKENEMKEYIKLYGNIAKEDSENYNKGQFVGSYKDYKII